MWAAAGIDLPKLAMLCTLSGACPPHVLAATVCRTSAQQLAQAASLGELRLPGMQHARLLLAILRLLLSPQQPALLHGADAASIARGCSCVQRQSYSIQNDMLNPSALQEVIKVLACLAQECRDLQRGPFEDPVWLDLIALCKQHSDPTAQLGVHSLMKCGRMNMPFAVQVWKLSQALLSCCRSVPFDRVRIASQSFVSLQAALAIIMHLCALVHCPKYTQHSCCRWLVGF